jgi:hypothetical protein
MGDKINKLDEVFQKSLTDHSVNPKPEVWDRLSEKLDKNGRAVIFIWWKWAAAAAVVIISIWLMYQPNDQDTKNTATNAPGELKTIEKTPIAPPAIQRRNESEELPKVAQYTSKGKIKDGSRNQPTKRKTAQESIKVKEDMLTIDRTPEILPPALVNVNHGLDNMLMTPEIDKADLLPSITLVEVRETNFKDYKVKIISNGYAIQPEKEKLVGALENKIGGFISKLDEGFGDLQDAKNNLFASLTTKRDKKNN